MFGIGTEELVLILVIVLVLFGGKKLPELSRSIGQSIRELRKGFTEDPAKADAKAPGKKSATKA